MQSSQTQVVVGTIDGDVLIAILLKILHEFLEIFLSSDFAHVSGGKVAVHSRAVPIARDRLAMEFKIDTVILPEARHQKPSDPNVVGRLPGAFAENLEFPLALGYLRINSLMSNARVETEIEMLVDNVTRKVPHVGKTHARVVSAPRRRKPVIGEPERSAVLVEEILLLETEPGLRVIKDGRPRIARMGSSIGPEHL